MTALNKQALREAAEKATPGRVGDRIDGSCSIKYECHGYDGSLVLRTDHKNMEYGFIGDNGNADELFFRLCVPDVVLALLDELEAKDKSIGFLKDQLAQLANFNPDWDRLEAAIDSLREHMAKLSAAEKRIAELEARTVCLPKLPVLGSNAEWYEGFAAGASGMRNECADAIRAAGIGVKGE
ncbi:TPA: ead/Ea22-like family protein [Citrobacter freundii]|nr:ead/Ea22-like family protein [Citrobacter freundii]HCL6760230.1 ead/Ea22-like family protein [Citrobacter freundii]HED2425064.1 ead/Ea22-like family protein [Citrobacter freundii]HED3099539.1 ead/Ea22-like family protein [Citrobacter freundii]HED3129698.1 ead/Ea22-like family protein [Citrobacter freundii]